MKVRYLSYNEVLDVYREQISRFGGFCAIRDNNALLSVIANPQRQFAGRDLYPKIASKAAILVFSMIKNHPFVEGNKRTAFVCGRMLLRLNGHDVSSIEEYDRIIWKIAKSEATLEDVSDWFKVSIVPISEAELRRISNETT